ncbi:MAG: alpha/beta fold hydrolase [Nanoarchaeota archaeon]|nr:alpha/beta fold hydrolase [Nanoarchaeota archaeon]
MDYKQVNRKARSINLKSNSDVEFLLIHGYTGSPTDFDGLPEYLHKKLNVNVRVPRLIGHGTNISDLDNLSLDDFLNQVEGEIKSSLKNKKRVILGGISFGGLLALYFASKYPLSGTFNVVSPYRLKFNFLYPFLFLLSKVRKHWTKSISKEERELRKNSFHYSKMHGNGLVIVKSLVKKINKDIFKIRCPCLTIHSFGDKLSKVNGAQTIYSKVGSEINKIIVLDSKAHNIFFSNNNEYVKRIILEFFKDTIKKQPADEEVTAIVPAYNEEKRISDVLKVLEKSNGLKEIIVIDDGSTDRTVEVVRKFKKVKLIVNKTNIGKAGSMDVGVKNTKSEIIFFCDADLNNLTPEIVSQIIFPVKSKTYDMFIGLRGNFMQSSVHKWAINSGERALRREVWENLPKYYKHRYRVEAGLNDFVRYKSKRGFGYKKFDYSQTLKETKYGFLRGTLLRWWMNLDVAMAVLRFHLYDRFK